MANEINKIKIESTEYTLQDSRVDSLVTGVSSVNGKTGDVTIGIPTVNNATLTIQKNGTNVATFTANASSNATANITVPTTASDVGAAPKKAGVYLVKGNTTGTAGTWTGTSSDFTDYYDGLVVAYDIGIAGADTTTLNINGKGAKTVYLRGTTKLTTHYAVGTIILLVYSADAGCWYKADYDANTNTYQRLYPTTTNAEYPITTRYNTTTGSEYYAEFGRYSTGVTLNPSTKTITATTFKGALDGNAKTATTATTASNATKLGGQEPSYYALASSIPTKTSQLTNNSEFITSNDSVKSVIDYGNTSQNIKIGYAGAGISGDNIKYIAGYTSGDSESAVRIKDISKDALKNWLEYSIPVNATNSAVLPSACTSNGFYYVSSTTNSLTDKDGNPFLQYHSSDADFRILATAYSSSWLQQIATDFRSEHVYVRRCESGTWKPWAKINYSNATTSADGLMSAADKTKLNGISNITDLDLWYDETSNVAVDANGITWSDGFALMDSGGSTHIGGSLTTKAPIVAGDGISITANSTTATISWPLADIIYEGTGSYSVCIGRWGQTASSTASIALGDSESTGSYSIAAGNGATASNSNAIAMGYNSEATGTQTVSIGYSNVAAKTGSVCIGYNNETTGDYGTAMGYNNYAGAYQTVVGRRATNTAGPTSGTDKTGNLFVVGNGTGTSARTNAFRVQSNGAVYGLSAYNSTGADYAEMWEWADGNPNNEDRRGKFVTVDENNKIRVATPDDEYILGIISATPCVVGDTQSEIWHKMYLKDVFGTYIIETKEIAESKDETTGEIIPAHTEKSWVLNPEYDPTRPYVSRDERKEWAAVGLMGKLLVIDDGTCVAGRYCKLTGNGTATASTDKNDWRVLKRMDSTHVQILYR